MTATKNGAHDELGSSTYLLKRLETDMLAVHRQMEVLKIVFDNLQGSWLAISLAHKAFRLHTEDKS
jgi:hypothetical protein